MNNCVLIFIAQFCMIFLLGIQSMNIRDGNKLFAAITSLLLGMCGWYITGIISSAYNGGNVITPEFFSFLVAGPVGIVCSIVFYDYLGRNKCRTTE